MYTGTVATRSPKLGRTRGSGEIKKRGVTDNRGDLFQGDAAHFETGKVRELLVAHDRDSATGQEQSSRRYTAGRVRWSLTTSISYLTTGKSWCRHGSMKTFQASTLEDTSSVAKRRRRFSMGRLMVCWPEGLSSSVFSRFSVARCDTRT